MAPLESAGIRTNRVANDLIAGAAIKIASLDRDLSQVEALAIA